MGYYIRVLGRKNVFVPVAELRACLPLNSKVEIHEETSDHDGWSQLILRHLEGPYIALVERNPVVPGELGGDEINEFVEEAQDAKPASAAKWLVEYLSSVTEIYAFQLLSGTDVKDGWSAVHAVRSYIWKQVGGILQADSEGFSNEKGHHILWQFSETVDGEWDMAVLNKGEWIAFSMNLGNPEHRRAFLNGTLPPGVCVITDN